MILIKFCIAFNYNKEILLSNMFGLLANILLNIYFIDSMGVAGIVLSASLSILIALLFLMFFLRIKGNTHTTEMLFLFSFRIFFILSIFCLYNRYYIGFSISSFAIILNTFSLYREYLLKDKIAVFNENIL